MTNLPLRRDGGIDWDKAMLMVVANSSHNTMHILTAIKREKEFVAATLERVAKWHGEQAVLLRQRASNISVHSATFLTTGDKYAIQIFTERSQEHV